MENYVDMPSLGDLSSEGTQWIEEALPNFSFSGFVKEITSGKNLFKPDNVLDTLLNIFAKELYSAVKMLSVIVAIVIISALLENLRQSFNKTSSLNSEIVVTALLAGLAGEIFSQSHAYAYTLSSDITKIMWALLPVLTTLIAGSGFTLTGVATHPVLYFMCNVFVEVFNKILIPASVVYLAISLADLISDTIQLGKLRELIRKFYNFLLGIIMTLFTGLLSISSFAGASFDSVGAKGVKFAVSNMVPLVGRSISDAMGAVASASVLLKNAVGITGIVCMIALGVVPVIKIAVTILAVRISAAVCEPIASSRVIQILTAVADSLSMINAALIATVVMMIIAVAIIIGIK